jgi:hypothetical protein
MAALDAEQQAAEAYADLVQCAGGLPWSEEARPDPLGDPGWGVDWP